MPVFTLISSPSLFAEYIPLVLGTIVENKFERGIIMYNKWLLMLAGVSLSVILMAGCNNNQEPPPPENNVKTPAPVDEDVNDTNDLNDQDNGTAPGVDKNDNMLKDDENDNAPDPEDPIEDPKDMTDPDNKDE